LRYREKQLYKKFLKVIEIPLSCQFDTSLKDDIKFYASFLVIFAAKMKKDWIRKGNNYFETGLNLEETIKQNFKRKKTKRHMIEEQKMKKNILRFIIIG
jgi:hypothetical protein